jgi:hypothetical protein
VPTNPSNNQPITSGGSATPWTVKFVPATATCSGDTASQGYHVYSYIVPSSVDPGTLTFDPSNGPSQGFPLVDTSGSPYMAKNTAVTTGQIIDFPALSFNYNIFSANGAPGTAALPPGNYNVGIACATTLGQGDRYWNVVKTFTASATDPNGETWALPTATTPQGGNGLVLPLGAAALLGVGLVVQRRRHVRTVAAAA